MTFKEIAEVGAAIITGLGGGGAIVLGLSSYIGKRWADRALEKQKQEYSQLNIAFQSQLDIATRRLQVELDALGLVHKLRTQEEFSQLPELWKRMANLRNCFATLAQRGGILVQGEAAERKKWDAKVREDFNVLVNDAAQFLAQNGLFIPKRIHDAAQTAANCARREQFCYAMFRPYIETESTIPASSTVVAVVADMRENYYKVRDEAFNDFNKALVTLEELMRQHIEGDVSTGEEQK